MFTYDFGTSDLQYFLIVLTRVSCFVYSAPFYSTSNTPQRIRIGLSVFISMLIYRFVTPHMELDYSKIMGYAIIVFKEACLGILIGFAANMCMSVVQFAGTLIDMDIGLSMVNMFDPVSRQQVGFTGALYQYGMLLILMISGMHYYILQALVASFERIPVGRVHFNMDAMMFTMLKIIKDIMLLGFRIFLPIFAAMLLLNAVLGILAKVAPQMNMFTVGIQIKILVGLGILFITIGLLPEISAMVYDEIKVLVTLVIGDMG